MTPQDAYGVKLVEMDETRFREYREHLVRDYARDKVRAGVWSETGAEDKAAKEVDGLLPAGPATPGHFVYSVGDESVRAEVGVLWVSPRELGRTLWIYDIIVHERFRRRGYASRMLKLAEDRARELGAGKVELHVFGHNHGARTLYEKLGYSATSIVMSKPVG